MSAPGHCSLDGYFSNVISMKLKFASDICLKMLGESCETTGDGVGLLSQDGLQMFWSNLVPI